MRKHSLIEISTTTPIACYACYACYLKKKLFEITKWMFLTKLIFRVG